MWIVAFCAMEAAAGPWKPWSATTGEESLLLVERQDERLRLRVRKAKRADAVVCAEVTAPARSAWARYLEVAVARQGAGDMVLIEPPPALLGPSAAGSCGVGLAVRDGAVALTVVPLGDVGSEITITLTAEHAASLASWLAAPRAVARP